MNQLKYAKVSFILLVLAIPVTIATKLLAIYLPKKVVYDVVAQFPYSQILKSLLLIIMALFIFDTFLNGSSTINFAYFSRLRQKMQYNLTMKNVSIDYQTIESVKYREMYSRAQRSLWASGMHCPLTQLSQSFMELITNIIGYLVYAAIILRLNPWIAIILTITSLISLYFTKRYQNYEYSNRDKWTMIDKKIWYVLNKSADFKIAKDIRIFGLDKWLSNIYLMLTKERMKWNKKLLFRNFLSNLVDITIILFRDGFAYYILISMIFKQKIRVDEFILYFGVISSFTTWIGSIIEKWNEINSISLTICDLRDVLDWEDETLIKDNVEKNLLGNDTIGDIQIDHLYFKYDNSDEAVIQDINLHIKNGEKIALVGENGAGKTTLIKNICGLYHPTSGEIKINGVSSSVIQSAEYYSLFSVMFQDMNILCVSIAEIVSSQIGDNIDCDLVWDCINRVGLHDKVMSLPNGIDTPLNKQIYVDGTDLSGGEKQKLVLAKALYKESPILILDEPTAALDPIAELDMYQKFNEITRDKTTIFISHRLASTRFCDRIFYIENGCIIEEGTHTELIDKGGKYAKMYEIQSHYYREKVGVIQ